MSFKKQNKAAAIREFMSANPGATAKEISVGVKCDITYVYLVQSADRRKAKKEVAPEEPTRGQEVLRRELMDAGKTIAGMEKLLQESDSQRDMLALEVAHLNVVIKYLERKTSGASV